MKRLSLVFIALVANPLIAEEVEWNQFRYEQPLTGELREKSIGVVPLEPETFEHTGDQFQDLRLIHESDSGEMEIPYLVVPREPARGAQEEAIPSEIEAVQKRDDGSLVVKIRLEKKKAAVRLVVDNRLRDFEKNVRVEGSEDGEVWNELVKSALLFDYSRFIDFRRSEVVLPQNSSSWFRITIEEATDSQLSQISTVKKLMSESSGTAVETTNTVEKRDFRIESLRFYTASRERGDKEESLRAYPVSISESAFDEERKRSEIILEVGRAPLTGLILDVEDTNFRRAVELQAESGDGVLEWRTIGRTEIFRYEIGDVKEERLRVPISESTQRVRASRFRLLVNQGDNLPVELSSVNGEGRIHDLYFVSPAKGSLKLRYGASGAEIRKPSYDVAAIRMGMRKRMAYTPFVAGEMIENPGYKEVEAPILWSEKRWLLYVVIVLIVVGLAWILVSSGREISEAKIE